MWWRLPRLFPIAIACLWVAQGAGQAFAENQPVILSGMQNDPIHKIASEVLVVAYDRIGVPVRFRWVPGKRALSEAARGQTGGDIARIAGTENRYKDLIPLSTPIVRFTAVAFTIKVEDDIRSWTDLKPYRVGVRRGSRYAANAVKDMRHVLGNSIPELFRHLVQGYVDVVVVAEIAGYKAIAAEFPDDGIRQLGDPLHVVPLYHYLHQDNKALVPRLDAVLQEMEKNGEISRIHRTVLNRIVAAY